MMILTVAVLIISMIAAAYVFLIMPRVADAADMDMQSVDYAHGGLASDGAPSGSALAIKEALRCAFGIEIGVALSKDKKLFVLSSSFDAKKFSLLQSSELSLRGYLTFRSLLDLVDGQVPLLVTLGVGFEKADPLLCKKLCLILDGYHGAFAIQSYDTATLSYFKNYRPRYARGQMISSKKSPSGSSKKAVSSFWQRHLFINVITRPDFISTEGSLIREPAFLIVTKLFGRQGFVRNVRNAKQYSICKKCGLYAVFERIRPQ